MAANQWRSMNDSFLPLCFILTKIIRDTIFPRLRTVFQMQTTTNNLLKLTPVIQGAKVVKAVFVRALNEKLLDSHLDDVESAVNCLLKHMAVLVQGERIETRGFGGIDLYHRSPRSAVIQKQVKCFSYP